MEKITIMIAAHKPFDLPRNNLYLPVQCGAALHDFIPGFQPDNEGDNISSQNPNFCELTAVYWAWKNLDADYIGLCHYRRFFERRILGKKNLRIADEKKIRFLLQKAPIILPKKRNYFIETNYSQYSHAHHEQDLLHVKDILEQYYPDYMPAFFATMNRTSGHRFNMFVMRKDYFDRYCGWLFDILFKLQLRVDLSQYSTYDQRIYGFIAERLLDIWIETEGCSYKELPVIHMEGQNWIKKGTAFLKRKWKGHP